MKSVKLFFDPERVEQFRARGIDPQRAGVSPVRQAQATLDLIEDNACLRAEITRLRADNQRLTAEVTQLRHVEAAQHLRADDNAARFTQFDDDLDR